MAAKGKSRKPAHHSPDAHGMLLLELQQIHNAESQLARVLPRLARAVESQTLQECIEQRQEEGERILKELEAAFDEAEGSPGRRRNAAAEGLINDVREHVQELESGPALDATVVAGIQKTGHYCIAAWGTARALGEACEQKTTVKAMERALKEGRSFDERLTQLAEKELMPALLEGADSEDQEESETGDEEISRSGRNTQRNTGSAERRTST